MAKFLVIRIDAGFVKKYYICYFESRIYVSVGRSGKGMSKSSVPLARTSRRVASRRRRIRRAEVHILRYQPHEYGCNDRFTDSSHRAARFFGILKAYVQLRAGCALDGRSVRQIAPPLFMPQPSALSTSQTFSFSFSSLSLPLPSPSSSSSSLLSSLCSPRIAFYLNIQLY